MSKSHVVYAVAESCPFDTLLVREMKRNVDTLLQLNLKRFRVPQKTMAKYSALDVMKQSLELMFEFSPSEKNYREAMRTIQVYSEGDEEMAQTLRTSFRFIANAVYNTYAGQRLVESLVPDILFLQGVPFDPTELQQAFRFVGVRPPEIPATIKQTIFLDDGFEPYKLLLEGKIVQGVNRGREKYWAKKIETGLSDEKVKALMCVGSEHLRSGLMHRLVPRDTGRITRLLRRSGIEVEVVERVADVNEIFAK